MLSYQTIATFPSLCYLHTLCYFVNLCHLVKLLSFYQTSVTSHPFQFTHFYVIYAPINVPALHTKTHDSLSRLIERTSSAPIHLSNSTVVFGHCAILIWGIEARLGPSLIRYIPFTAGLYYRWYALLDSSLRWLIVLH